MMKSICDMLAFGYDSDTTLPPHCWTRRAIRNAERLAMLRLSAKKKDRWIANGRTLIVGYDVAHPGKQTRDEIVNKMPPEKPSVVGVILELLPLVFQISFNGGIHPECFIGDYHFQKPHQEKVDHMVLNARFKWILGLFTKNRQVWPESVVITRDGVSEGQYKMVIEDVLNAIKEACCEFGTLHRRELWLPKFTVIVATKRHNARFVVNGEHLESPKPATVVDTDVVRGDLTEFYLQSHKPLNGTAKSTAYQVIVDENDMSMNEVQSLILALTFHHQPRFSGKKGVRSLPSKRLFIIDHNGDYIAD
ncbi:hypothetical protein KIN20_014002 [Parelaphostrongylus tenuis]|uniref:Piwi domain-containing protein n=1 Tax=Parelaphostrongylus tenuis TaxID=148309 RepID=A0AAD5QLE2_PARTN|nr:hypothetical protein KIN20_014002 [Parelaphostrongylus tenuis]